jgi:transcription elongation factor GreA
MTADAANMVTAAGLQELEAELAALEGEGRREIAERIKTAREWGDLKENSEYHKIAKLRERISAAEVVEASRASDGAVAFGSTVVVRDEAGKERSWQIVSSHDASPSEGRLSADSPVARALLGRRAGERAAVVLPKGESVLTVVSVA